MSANIDTSWTTDKMKILGAKGYENLKQLVKEKKQLLEDSKKGEIIQFAGASKDFDKVLDSLKYQNNELFMVDLTGNLSYEEKYVFYTTINPLNENLNEKFLFLAENMDDCVYVVNDGHLLTKEILAPLLALCKEKKISLVLFSNQAVLDLGLEYKSKVVKSDTLIECRYTFA